MSWLIGYGIAVAIVAAVIGLSYALFHWWTQRIEPRLRASQEDRDE